MKIADEVITAAIHPAAPAFVIQLFYDGELIGAASYRITNGEIKIVNMGSKRRGMGTKLFKMIKAEGMPIWCQSDPDAVGFYEKMGMKRCEILSDGRVIYRI